MFLTSTLARVLFALPWIAYGLIHFINADEMVGAVPVPGGIIWVYITGVAMIAAGVGIATRIMGVWAALGLALLMLVFILTIHVPATVKTGMAHLGYLLKDVVNLGAALAFAGILSSNEQ
jgi:uncharacterized membrane protein